MQYQLAQRHVSIITDSSDPEVASVRATLEHGLVAGGRCDLDAVIGSLLASVEPGAPKTLDLIGHTTADKLLRLGDWTIDASNPTVCAFFRELADHDVMARLGVHAVRLLSSLTAQSSVARHTLCTLSDLLGVEVFGTRDLMSAKHFGRNGFSDEHAELIACSSDLRREVIEPRTASWPVVDRRTLDLDALPAHELEPRSWPVRIATVETASAVLHLIARHHGAPMPGLLATRPCELALPSATRGRYHHLEILLDHEYVRVYTGDRAGIVFPVVDPRALEQLVERIPLR